MNDDEAWERYVSRANEIAERILEDDMHRRRWLAQDRDAIAGRLMAFANSRHAELTMKKRSKK